MARFQNLEKIMTKSTIAPNYSDVAVAQMISTYSAQTNAEDRKAAVSSIAKELGKTVKSVIAKLSREGVYVKAVPATKNGKAIVKKEAIVKAIATLLELDFADVKSLGKATKADLETLHKALI